jgi:Tfp pilus assembly protein PilN
MIKINLSPQRRPKTSNKGQTSFLVGLLTVAVIGAGVYILDYKPLSDDLERLRVSTNELARANQDKEASLKGFDELKKTIDAAQERRDVILRLNRARAVPAHMLHELSRILTRRRVPSMSERMQQEMALNPNRELMLDWEPANVWITRFTEKDGSFRLEGGALADSDMTQLALRLQASVYFFEVVPEGGSEQVDKDNNTPYYKFTISGKVAY